MTKRELDKLIKTHRIRGEKTIEALRLVLMDGLTAYEAAKQADVGEATISRAKKRLERPVCKCCGRPLED